MTRWAIALYESRRRVKGSLILAAAFSILSLVYMSMFPSMKGIEEDFLEAFPPAMLELLNMESFGTVEGFLAVEMYGIFWVVLLGIYFAYVGADSLAGDIQKGKMDLTLSCAVSRMQVVGEKVVSLMVPLVVLNTIIPLVVYGSVLLIGESIDPAVLIMVHLLSIPYLLSCMGFGVLASSLSDRSKTAGMAAVGAVFFFWLIEGLARVAGNIDWASRLMPAHYYNPNDILVHAIYDGFGAAVLMVLSLLLFLASMVIFQRRDI